MAQAVRVLEKHYQSINIRVSVCVFPGASREETEEFMTIYEMVTKMTGGELAGWAVVILVILMSLVQIAPVKVNPWDSIFGWLGKKLNGDMKEQMESL